METCTRKKFFFFSRDGREEIINLFCVFVYMFYIICRCRGFTLFWVTAWSGVAFRFRWQQTCEITCIYIYIYPSVFRIYYNNAPVTLDDSCFCETFTYMLSQLLFLPVMSLHDNRTEIDTRGKSKQVRNRFNVSRHNLRYSRMHISLYFTDPHVLLKLA